MYTPTKHTESNKSYAPSQGNPTDARSYFYDDTDGIKRQRIYRNTQEVLSEIIGVDRQGHIFFWVNTGGTIVNGFLSGGTNEPWYFKDGYADGDLVKVFPAPQQQQAETALTANDSTTINFTQSGTANHTFTGDVLIAGLLSQTAGNIINNDNGLFAQETPETADNGLTKDSANNTQLGGTLLHDTAISGAPRIGFTNGRVGIGMMPIFPLDISNTWANLGAQITSALPLQNFQARLGLLSAMLLTGGAFNHTAGDQVSGATGQLVWYQNGDVTLNKSSSYAGKSGLLIGYATARISNSIISSFSAISYFGNSGHYERVAGLRVTAPSLSGFRDAANFTGVIENYYGVIIEAFDPLFYATGTITNRWGFYQEGNEPNFLKGKIIFDSTLNAGTGNVTVNKPSGSFNIAAGQTTAIVTNNMVSLNSLVNVQLGTVDATAKSCVAVEANGSFTVTVSPAPTGAVRIKFWVTN